jgi:hypothetical protein
MNRKGQMNLFVGLLVGFLVISILVALIPALREQMISVSSYATGLNCKGAVDYNATAAEFTGGTSTTACLAFGLFIPFLVLAVLIGLVTKMLYDKGGQPAPQQYYGG